MGNLFFNPDECSSQQRVFEETASQLGLQVLCWRAVPRDPTILGPSASGQEPAIWQPFIALQERAAFDQKTFQQRLYLLRKKTVSQLPPKTWFYVCSLSSQVVVYKGLLSPAQVYKYFKDLTNPALASHFCIVHSRFSTNTFPSWDRAQVCSFAQPAV